MAPLYTSAWVDAATLAKMSGKDLQCIIDLNDAMALLAERSPSCFAESWLIMHGRHDEVLDYETTRQQIAELKRGGFALRFEAYDKGRTIDPQDELPMLRSFLAQRLGVR